MSATLWKDEAPFTPGPLPARVDLVVVGAGALGASIAWHARREGLSVLLVDRGDVAAGATSRAAALLTRARAKPALMPLVARTYAAIAELERDLGESLGLRQSGTLYGAASAAHVAALRDLVRVAEEAGIEVEWVGPGTARAQAPWLEADALEACAFMPEDGYIDPYLLASAYARSAAQEGALVRSRIAVRALLVDGGRVAGVETSAGRVEAGAVALAAGAWSGALAWRHGVALPMAPVRSQYWITERSPPRRDRLLRRRDRRLGGRGPRDRGDRGGPRDALRPLRARPGPVRRGRSVQPVVPRPLRARPLLQDLRVGHSRSRDSIRESGTSHMSATPT